MEKIIPEIVQTVNLDNRKQIIMTKLYGAALVDKKITGKSDKLKSNRFVLYSCLLPDWYIGLFRLSQMAMF